MKLTIKTIEAAFIAEGLDINKLPEVSHLENETDKAAVVNNYKLDVVIRALNNEGQKKPWKPDFSDRKKLKYENVYYFVPGSGWSLSSVDSWHANTGCGSRRVFRERSIGHHLWEHFAELIKTTL